MNFFRLFEYDYKVMIVFGRNNYIFGVLTVYFNIMCEILRWIPGTKFKPFPVWHIYWCVCCLMESNINLLKDHYLIVRDYKSFILAPSNHSRPPSTLSKPLSNINQFLWKISFVIEHNCCYTKKGVWCSITNNIRSVLRIDVVPT